MWSELRNSIQSRVAVIFGEEGGPRVRVKEQMGLLGAGTPSGEWHTVLGCAFGAGLPSLGDTVAISLYMFTFEFFSPWNIPPNHPSNPWLQWLSEATAHLTFSVRSSSLVAPLLSSGSPPGMPPASVLCIPLPSRGSSEDLCLHSDTEMKQR